MLTKILYVRILDVSRREREGNLNNAHLNSHALTCQQRGENFCRHKRSTRKFLAL